MHVCINVYYLHVLYANIILAGFHSGHYSSDVVDWFGQGGAARAMVPSLDPISRSGAHFKTTLPGSVTNEQQNWRSSENFWFTDIYCKF